MLNGTLRVSLDGPRVMRVMYCEKSTWPTKVFLWGVPRFVSAEDMLLSLLRYRKRRAHG